MGPPRALRDTQTLEDVYRSLTIGDERRNRTLSARNGEVEEEEEEDEDDEEEEDDTDEADSEQEKVAKADRS